MTYWAGGCGLDQQIWTCAVSHYMWGMLKDQGYSSSSYFEDDLEESTQDAMSSVAPAGVWCAMNMSGRC